MSTVERDLPYNESLRALGTGSFQENTHKQFAANVAAIRKSQQTLAQEGLFRAEMRFVQSRNDSRRAMWWSFTAYTLCLITTVSTLTLLLQPQVMQYWLTVCIAIAACAALLALVGAKRDSKHARNSWTRLRFNSTFNPIK
jgi:hypothetical protein